MAKTKGRYFYEPKLNIASSARVYANLRKEVTESGVLDRDYLYYALLCAITFGGFFLGLFLLYISNSIITILASGVFFSFFAVQVSGIFHDSGHRAVFKSTKNNDILGYFSCFLLAYVFTKWRVNHNKHHAKPNEEEMDPDIERPMFSFNDRQMRSKKGLWRTISKSQVFVYYPVGTLTGIYSQIANAFYFVKEPNKTKFWEKGLFTVGILCWTIAPFFVFGIGKALVIYLTIYPLLGFYLFNIFAPNHKGMPQIKKGSKISFLEQQIVTTRNIKPGLITDILLVGLNYQLEHHLFPECPRNKLKLLTPYVKNLCKNLNLEYTEVSLIKSNKIILAELNSVTVGA